jgi:hypothetical protein
MSNTERGTREGGSGEGGSGNLGGKEQTGGSQGGGPVAGQSKSVTIYDSMSGQKAGEAKVN